MSKYDTRENESETLPNLQNLSNAEDIAIAELEGFMFSG